jgi:hypothetical protein
MIIIVQLKYVKLDSTYFSGPCVLQLGHMSQAITKIWNDLNSSNRSLYLLVSPSWLSGLLTVVGALALIAATLIATQFPRSNVWELLQTRPEQSQAVNDNYQVINDGFSLNSFISNIPLMIFWAFIGMLVYSLVINLINAYQHAADIKQEMGYVNIDRHKLVHEVVVRFAVQVAVLILWLCFIVLTLKLLLPYSIAAVQYAAGSDKLTDIIFYNVMAFAIMAVSLHLHAVFLRLLRLRPRFFGQF